MGPRYPKWLVIFKIRISRFADASSHRSWHNESAEKMFEKTPTEILLLRCVLFPLLKWQRKIVDIRKNCQSKNYLGGTKKKKCLKARELKSCKNPGLNDAWRIKIHKTFKPLWTKWKGAILLFVKNLCFRKRLFRFKTFLL